MLQVTRQGGRARDLLFASSQDTSWQGEASQRQALLQDKSQGPKETRRGSASGTLQHHAVHNGRSRRFARVGGEIGGEQRVDESTATAAVQQKTAGTAEDPRLELQR